MRERKLTRLQNYDYTQGGYYFVTVCTQGRQEWFGKIEKGEMILNEYGTIVAIHWVDIPKYYPNALLDEWVIMPNHIHGIITILSHVNSSDGNVGTEQCSVPTNTKSVSLSQIVKSFKGATIKRIRSDFGDIRFAWQRSFYDHIIRDEKSLQDIRKYIKENPLKWEFDKENPKRGGRNETLSGI